MHHHLCMFLRTRVCVVYTCICLSGGMSCLCTRVSVYLCGHATCLSFTLMLVKPDELDITGRGAVRFDRMLFMSVGVNPASSQRLSHVQCHVAVSGRGGGAFA